MYYIDFVNFKNLPDEVSARISKNFEDIYKNFEEFQDYKLYFRNRDQRDVKVFELLNELIIENKGIHQEN